MTDPNTSPSMALATLLPDDIMADLLKAQAGSITTTQQLPEIDVLAQGVGLFEFKDQPGRMEKTFRGVILNNHPRNILWDTVVGQAGGAPNEKPKPACSSNNGIVGIVREGFAHKGLPMGEVGDGTKTVACATCPYNQFGTGNWFNTQKSPKGKAVQNQRAIYIMVEGVAVPYRLTLSATSLASIDEYMMALTSRRIPVQVVVTEFSQAIENKNGQKYAIVKFAMVGQLDNAGVSAMLSMREQWKKSIEPAAAEVPLQATATAGEAVADAMAADAPADGAGDFPAALEDQDDDLPF